MKKLFYIGIIVFITSILTACDVTVNGNPVTLRVHGAALSSNYRDAGGRSYICDNHDTLLTYRFDFTGRLDSWRSYLKGADSGRIKGEEEFYPYTQGVIAFGHDSFEVTYVIHRGSTPLSTDSNELSSQSIITIPAPQIIGYTYLHLDIYGRGQSSGFISDPPLPVVVSC